MVKKVVREVEGSGRNINIQREKYEERWSKDKKYYCIKSMPFKKETWKGLHNYV